MTDDGVARIIAFVNDRLRPGDMADPVVPSTPLLRTGVLDSLKTAVLLNWIRSEFGVTVPADMMELRNFEDVERIAALVRRLSEPPTR